tara:strand:- start:715 stop:1545 length:831 start_codon:yes stop_codon:yes gene_type:complete
MKKLLGIVVLGLLWCSVGFANSSLPKCSGSDDSKYTNCYGQYSNKILAPGYTRTFEGEYGNVPGKREGQGSSTIYKDGKFYQSFKGEFKNNKPYYGTEKYSHGFKYEGEFIYGVPSFGKLYAPPSEKQASYVGMINSQLQPIGFGRLLLDDDTIALGEFDGSTSGGAPKLEGLGFGFLNNQNKFVAVFRNDEPQRGITEHQLEELQDKEKAFLKREIDLLVKSKVILECDDLGFITGTQEYEDCNLKLTVLYKEEAIIVLLKSPKKIKKFYLLNRL